MAEKVNRNTKIYEYINSGIPQITIAHHAGISRQSVGQIYTRYCEKYGSPEPMTKDITTIDISMHTKRKLKQEAQRLRTSIATVIRLAINQSIERNGKNPITPVYARGALTEKSSLTKATETQFDHLTEIQETEGINRAEALRLIIANYDPISITF